MFYPTIEIAGSCHAIADAIVAGTLKLNPGQWLKAGGVRGQFVGVSLGGTLWVCWAKAGQGPQERNRGFHKMRVHLERIKDRHAARLFRDNLMKSPLAQHAVALASRRIIPTATLAAYRNPLMVTTKDKR